jgi:hypothetical protein
MSIYRFIKPKINERSLERFSKTFQNKTMKINTIKNTQICKEHNEEFFSKWFFNKKERKFISHVDTFDYTVTIELDEYTILKEYEPWQNFVNTLRNSKEIAEEINEPVKIFEDIADGLAVVPYATSQMYTLHFGLNNNFDIFVCASPPNAKTPQIKVNIRSASLWINGIKNTFDNSYECLEKVLAYFGLKMQKTQENRIDYTFHSNYFHKLLNAFPECDYGKMFVGNFERFERQGTFHTHDDNEYDDMDIEIDYLTFGRRKSNNIFFRIYDKTKEVVQKGQKQFFIELWYKYNLINDFDRWVLERAFLANSWESVDRFRCEFYMIHGEDRAVRYEIMNKIEEKAPAAWFTKRAKGLVPEITSVMNIEIETKRKFYERKKLDMLTSEESPKRNVYNIFEQMSNLIDFITDKTIRFVNYKGDYANVPRLERPMADWWQRLRNAERLEIKEEWEVTYLHFYQHGLDKAHLHRAAVKKIAKLLVHIEHDESLESSKVNQFGSYESFIYHDIEKILSTFTDKDYLKYADTKESGHEELKTKLRQNECNRVKYENRPVPLRRNSMLPVACYTCVVCGETKSGFEVIKNLDSPVLRTCIECLKGEYVHNP